MKEDNIYGTDVELYAAAQLLRRNLYIYHRYGGHQQNGSSSHAVRKGYARGGKAFTWTTDLVWALMGISIMCF